MAKDHTMTREELFEAVWTTPMSRLARTLGLSDVGLAKVCKRFGIPRPPVGYWQKLAVGRAPNRPNLPNAPERVDDSVGFDLAGGVKRLSDVPSGDPEIQQWVSREALEENLIVVPERVPRYHPLVRDVKETLGGLQFFGIEPEWAVDGDLSLKVSKPHLLRSCRVLNSFVIALEERGSSLEPQQPAHLGTKVHLLGETVLFTLEELNRSKLAPGRLRLKLECLDTREIFRDEEGRPLESQLNEVILAIVRLAIEVHRPFRLGREAEERARLERIRQQRIFEERRDLFEKGLKAWKQQQERVRFVDELEKMMSGAALPAPAHVREFVEWARRYADRGNALGALIEAVSSTEDPEFYRYERDPVPPWRSW